MSDLCDSVHAFADGELSLEEAETFRVHLATCTRCQAELAEIMQLTAGAAQLAPAPVASIEPINLAWYRRSRTLAAILIPLAAAVLAVFLFPRDPRALPAYTMSGPTGFLEHTRGSTHAPAKAEPLVFIPDSVLALKLLPAEELSGRDAVAGVFVADPGSALSRVKDVDVRSTEQGSFAIRTSGRAVFGEAPGSKIFYAVIASSERALAALDGVDPSALAGDRELRVFSVPVEYRTTP